MCACICVSARERETEEWLEREGGGEGDMGPAANHL